jgi:hypothetical protein
MALLINAMLLSAAPWPIYVDLSRGTLIWRPAAETFAFLEPGAIPVTVGALTFAAFCLINALRVRGLSIRTEPVKLPPVLSWAVIALLLLLFGLSTLAGGSASKFVQLYVGLLAVYAVRLPVVESDIRFLSRVVFLSFFVFLAIHIVSTFTSPFLYTNWALAYSTFLTGYVHGALVSYPAVLFLYGAVLLVKSINSRHQLGLVIAGIVPILFALLANRRETVVQVIALGAILAIGLARLSVSRRNDRLLFRSLKVAVVVIAAIVYMVQMEYVTTFGRLFGSEEGVDPRLAIWAEATPTSLADLVVGNMRASNTAHSFGFSVLESFGLVGLVPMVLITAGVVKFVGARPRRRTRAAPGPRLKSIALRPFFLWAFGISVVSSNLFNTNITQTYYVVNLIVLYLLLRTADTGLRLAARTAA